MKVYTHDAVCALLPEVEWVMYGEDLQTLTILTPNVTPPTQDQVNTWLQNNQ